jgi:hypothetical protein
MFNGHTLVLLTGTEVDKRAMRFAAQRATTDGSRVFAIRVHVDQGACEMAALTPYQFQGIGTSLHPPYELEDTASYADELLRAIGSPQVDVEPMYLSAVDPDYLHNFIREAGIGVLVASRMSGCKCDSEVCRTVRASPVPVVSLPIVEAPN